MPDFMDHVQHREQVDRDIALAAVVQPREGAPDCDNCGAAISSLRRSLGARLCLQHQEELEQAQRRRR